METKHFQLIDGTFTPSESRDLLFALLKSNINFFKLQSLSMQERGESDTLQPAEQIENMKYMEASLQKLIRTASANNLQLQISGSIEITVVPLELEATYNSLAEYA